MQIHMQIHLSSIQDSAHTGWQWSKATSTLKNRPVSFYDAHALQL